MPRRSYNLRLSSKDLKAVRSLVTRFNSKVGRVSKANPGIAAVQPPKLKTKELVNYFKTENSRAEFNRKMQQYGRYLEKGQELPQQTQSGAVTTKWQLGEIARSIKAENRRIAKLAKKNPDIITDTPYRKNRSDTIKAEKFNEYAQRVDRRLAPSYINKLNDTYYNNILGKYKDMYGENSRIYRRVSAMNKEDFIEESLNNRALSMEYNYEPVNMKEKEQAVWDELNRIGAPEIEDDETPLYPLDLDIPDDEGFIDTSIIRRPLPPPG